jgi:hypothetical protein
LSTPIKFLNQSIIIPQRIKKQRDKEKQGRPGLTFSLFNAIVPLIFGESKIGKTAMMNDTND